MKTTPIYEETVIDGVPHYRTQEGGVWKPYTVQALYRRCKSLEAELRKYRASDPAPATYSITKGVYGNHFYWD